MRKLLILLLTLGLLVLAGCGEEKEEEGYGYETLVQNFVDVQFGSEMPSKETVRSLRHEAMWDDDFDAEYQEYVEEWTYNNGVLKEVFGEDYTYTVNILSSTGDVRARDAMQDLLNRIAPDTGAVGAYSKLELEITFSGNGKTYVAEGKLELFACFEGWFTTSSLMESVNNVRMG